MFSTHPFLESFQYRTFWNITVFFSVWFSDYHLNNGHKSTIQISDKSVIQIKGYLLPHHVLNAIYKYYRVIRPWANYLGYEFVNIFWNVRNKRTLWKKYLIRKILICVEMSLFCNFFSFTWRCQAWNGNHHQWGLQVSVAWVPSPRCALRVLQV